MGGGEKKVWPVWEFFKWFLGLSSHTMAAIGTCFCFCVYKRDERGIDSTTVTQELISIAPCLCCSGLALVEMFQSSQPSQFILQQKESLQKDLEELLGTDGVLLYPSHPQLAPKHHQPLFTPFNFSYTGQPWLFFDFLWCLNLCLFPWPFLVWVPPE